MSIVKYRDSHYDVTALDMYEQNLTFTAGFPMKSFEQRGQDAAVSRSRQHQGSNVYKFNLNKTRGCESTW